MLASTAAASTTAPTPPVSARCIAYASAGASSTAAGVVKLRSYTCRLTSHLTCVRGASGGAR